MTENVLIAFASPVNKNYIESPIIYSDIQGEKYSAVQTNETAVVCLERMLQKKSLAQIFLIVSDKVKNEIVPTETEFGEVTHLEFLKRRLIKEFPQLEGKFFEIDYSDDNTDIEGLKKNILQIAEIADSVTNYANKFADKKITVHADMTGGFRHTSMLMLSIIQLLKYRGMQIGEVLYTDPIKKIVYRANEIQETFTLITGADEFIKFGSVEALQEYFTKNPAASSAALLDAMNRFSEAIKICRTSAIESELKNLGKQIKIFRESKNKDLKSELFAKIIDTVEESYGVLISENVSRPDIIRWCIDKGFWQQAMALCTEWLPEEIVNRGILKPKNEMVIRDAEIDGMSFGRNWKQHLVINYQRNNLEKISSEMLDIFCRPLKDTLNYCANPKFNIAISDDYGILKKVVEEFHKGRGLFSLCKSGRFNFSEFRKKYPLMYKIFLGVYDEFKNRSDYRKNFEGFLRTLKYDNLFVYLSEMKSQKLLQVLNVEKNVALKLVLKQSKENFEPPASKWEEREKIYNKMLESGIITSELDDRNKMLKLLRDYYEIRKARNRINHAAGNSSQDIPKLKSMIENYLDELEKI